jgi:hypothetical protein
MASLGLLALTAVTTAAVTATLNRPRIRKLNLKQSKNSFLDIYNAANPIHHQNGNPECILFITGFRDVPAVFSSLIDDYPVLKQKYDYYIPRNIGTGRTFLQENVTFKDWILHYKEIMDMFLLPKYEKIHIITKDIGYSIALYLYKNYADKIGNILFINPEEKEFSSLPRRNLVQRKKSNNKTYFEPIVSKSQIQESLNLLKSNSPVTFPDSQDYFRMIVSKNSKNTLKGLVSNVYLKSDISKAVENVFGLYESLEPVEEFNSDKSALASFDVDTSSMSMFKSYNNLKTSQIKLYWNSNMFNCLAVVGDIVHRVLKLDDSDVRYKNVSFFSKPENISTAILDAYYGEGEIISDYDLSSWELVEEPLSIFIGVGDIESAPGEQVYYSKFRNAFAVKNEDDGKYYVILNSNNEKITLESELESAQKYALVNDLGGDWITIEDTNIPDVIVTSSNKDTVNEIEKNNALLKVHEYLGWHLTESFMVGKSYLNLGTRTQLLLLTRDYVSIGEIIQYCGRDHFHIMYDFVADVFLVLYGRKYNNNNDVFWKEPTWRILRMAGSEGGYRHVQLRDMIQVGEEKVNGSFTKQIWNRFFINVSKSKQEDIALFANKNDIFTKPKAGILYTADINTRSSMYFETLFYRDGTEHNMRSDSDMVYTQRFFLKEQLISCFYGEDSHIGRFVENLPKNTKIPSRYGTYRGGLYFNLRIRNCAELVPAIGTFEKDYRDGGSYIEKKDLFDMYKCIIENAFNREVKTTSVFQKRPIGYVCETERMVCTDTHMKDFIMNFLFKYPNLSPNLTPVQIRERELLYSQQNVASHIELYPNLTRDKYYKNYSYRDSTEFFKANIRSYWNLKEIMKYDMNVGDWNEENDPDIVKLYSKLWL